MAADGPASSRLVTDPAAGAEWLRQAMTAPPPAAGRRWVYVIECPDGGDPVVRRYADPREAAARLAAVADLETDAGLPDGRPGTRVFVVEGVLWHVAAAPHPTLSRPGHPVAYQATPAGVREVPA